MYSVLWLLFSIMVIYYLLIYYYFYYHYSVLWLLSLIIIQYYGDYYLLLSLQQRTESPVQTYGQPGRKQEGRKGTGGQRAGQAASQ